MKFIKAQLKSASIELLEAGCYPHVLTETIERQTLEVLIKLCAPFAKLISGEFRSPKLEQLTKQVQV